MPRRKARFPSLTADQAHAALRWLHALGKITAKDIARALGERERLVAEIRARLEELGGEGARFLTSIDALRRPSGTRRRRRKASARVVAVWKAQGRYLAAVRHLSKSNRAKVAAVRKAKGVGAAIATAKRIARA